MKFGTEIVALGLFAFAALVAAGFGVDEPFRQHMWVLFVVLVGFTVVLLRNTSFARAAVVDASAYMDGPIRYGAIATMFWGVVGMLVGVIIALQPSGESLSVPALVALVGSFSFSLLMICTRLVRGTSDVVLVSWQMLGALAFGAVAAPFTWTPMNVTDLGLLLLLGIVAMGAHMCINRSLIVAPPSVVVPYQYTTIIWAILLGYWFFGDVPQTAMLVGCAVIIAAGIYIFMRERRLAYPPFPSPAD